MLSSQNYILCFLPFCPKLPGMHAAALGGGFVTRWGSEAKIGELKKG